MICDFSAEPFVRYGVAPIPPPVQKVAPITRNHMMIATPTNRSKAHSEWYILTVESKLHHPRCGGIVMSIFHKPTIGMTSQSHVQADLPAREDSLGCFVSRGPLVVLWASGCVVGTGNSPQSHSDIGNTSGATSGGPFVLCTERLR
jgi:hypothetical protein